MGRLNEIGRESLETSAAKGFQTVTPEDWRTPAEWDRLAMRGSASEYTAQFSAMDPSEILVRSERALGLVPTKLALIHSEVSEALEEFRKQHRLDVFMGELADIIIRVGQLGVGLGGDLDRAVDEKLAANKLREHQHGGRLI